MLDTWVAFERATMVLFFNCFAGLRIQAPKLQFRNFTLVAAYSLVLFDTLILKLAIQMSLSKVSETQFLKPVFRGLERASMKVQVKNWNK